MAATTRLVVARPGSPNDAHSDIPGPSVRRMSMCTLTGTNVVRSGLWRDTKRDLCQLETTVSGVLAAGDICAGSTKRVRFAVGVGSLAVTCAHRLLSIRA